MINEENNNYNFDDNNNSSNNVNNTNETNNETVSNETPKTPSSESPYFCHVYKTPGKEADDSEKYKVDVPAQQPSEPQPPKKKKWSAGKIAVSVVAICLIASMAGACFGVAQHFVSKAFGGGETKAPGTVDSVTPPTVDPSITIDPTIKIEGETGEGVTTGITEMVKAVMPAMVSINVTSTTIVDNPFGGFFGGGQQEYEVEGSGSGIVISQTATDLFIVTNYHVIEGAKKISVCFIDGKYYEATVKGSDSDYDLAVITIPLSSIESDTLSQIKTAVVGSSETLNLGEPAIAIGNALGYGQSVTVGYISALARQIEMEDKTMTLIQTDAAINPGNSGGALLNINGEVIGINSAKFASTEVEGMGFAIPISDAVPIINEIINETAIPEDEQAYLGITGSTVESSWVSYYGWPEGVYISSITEGSPADKAGIKAHDIIVKFDGRDVTTIDSLTERLKKKKGGDVVEITIMRQNNYGKFEEKVIQVTLGSKKDAQ